MRHGVRGWQWLVCRKRRLALAIPAMFMMSRLG